MPRFFVKKEKITDNIGKISGDDARHIARSLRMAVGDIITVSDGEGNEYQASLSKIRDEECLFEIQSVSQSDSESPVSITLYVAYPKGDKLETVIQKAVELGANAIVPFESSRCIKRPPKEKLEKLTARHSKIAEEAAKQCGRSRLPSVSSVISYEEMLSEAKKSSLILFCYENENGSTLKTALEKAEGPKDIAVIIGSEGGFSPEEANAAILAGAVSVSLGKRILRCETAPLYVLSALSYIFEL